MTAITSSSMPMLRIEQTFAQIGVKQPKGDQKLSQPMATFELSQPKAEQSIQQELGTLQIDQSRAWDALAQGGVLKSMHRIFNQSSQIALEGIAQAVHEGDILMSIENASNGVVEVVKQAQFRHHALHIAGPASIDNVDIQYTPQKPMIDAVVSDVQLYTRPNKVIHDYTPQKVNIYMKQQASINIIPPEIDLQI
ncbi:DUF6470 family protein [Longirhabdus pacifica]|uniref:DUF6470 family protein n=1 Tax=Longirhabdus pacifica TaxID=2305227 RepID=UPI001008B0D6|nr:DUF6470 family protein [Longirhabdus pacifica]